MAKFKNLSQLQAHLEKNVHKILSKSASVERILAEAMSQGVIDVVYEHYSPSVYERRGDEGGLSDVRNMEISSVTVEDGKVKLIMENLTKGNDSMSGEYISDMIIEGDESAWSNPVGAWSVKRDYITYTVDQLKNNPSELIEELKSLLKNKGYRVL